MPLAARAKPLADEGHGERPCSLNRRYFSERAG